MGKLHKKPDAIKGYLRRLAQLRGLPLAAIQAAAEDGILSFQNYLGQFAWCIRDEQAGCARRLDGEPWEKGNESLKCLDMEGTSGRSNHWPVGVARAIEYSEIIICEGGPDLLAAYAARQELRTNFGIICVFGSELTIRDDKLNAFNGRTRHAAIDPLGE